MDGREAYFLGWHQGCPGRPSSCLKAAAATGMGASGLQAVVRHQGAYRGKFCLAIGSTSVLLQPLAWPRWPVAEARGIKAGMIWSVGSKFVGRNGAGSVCSGQT